MVEELVCDLDREINEVPSFTGFRPQAGIGARLLPDHCGLELQQARSLAGSLVVGLHTQV